MQFVCLLFNWLAYNFDLLTAHMMLFLDEGGSCSQKNDSQTLLSTGTHTHTAITSKCPDVSLGSRQVIKNTVKRKWIHHKIKGDDMLVTVLRPALPKPQLASTHVCSWRDAAEMTVKGNSLRRVYEIISYSMPGELLDFNIWGITPIIHCPWKLPDSLSTEKDLLMQFFEGWTPIKRIVDSRWTDDELWLLL